MQVAVKNPTCLQLWVMLLMSNPVNYKRLFKVYIEIPQIIFLIKMPSEHKRRVVFTLVSMKHVV